MMKCLLCLFGLTVAIPSLGQKFELKIDSVIKAEITRKKNINVREIGYTKLACINYGITATAYLSWTEGNITYIQKFEDSEYEKTEVLRFEPITVVDSVFFPFYTSNKDFLILQDVKSFQYRPDYITVTSHSCFRHFTVFTEDLIFSKYFDYFDLEEFDSEQIDNSRLSKERIEELRLLGLEADTLYKRSPRKNINFESNNELKIIEWDELISKFLDKIELMNRFIEIK